MQDMREISKQPLSFRIAFSTYPVINIVTMHISTTIMYTFLLRLYLYIYFIIIEINIYQYYLLVWHEKVLSWFAERLQLNGAYNSTAIDLKKTITWDEMKVWIVT